MPRMPVVPSLWWLVGPLLLALACSHDSPRDNPLDPQLTPPVQLQVALDDTAGVARLTWTRYSGEQPFGAYWVLRNIDKSTEVDTLERIQGQAQTAFIDTSLAPNTDYVYRVSVVNAEGLEQPSTKQRVDGYVTRAVRLLRPHTDPATGAIHLTWTRYRDPGFECYEVRRRAVGMEQDSVLSTIADVDDTTFSDTTPYHKVDYLYSAVVGAAGQELPSPSVEGQISLPGVAVTEAQFVSYTASCSLAWTPYRGPRFRAYQVRRRSEEEPLRTIAELTDSEDTICVDSDLLAGTEYHYQVAVLTENGEEVPGEGQTGSLHRLVDVWPLDVEGEGASREYVRLYAEEGDRIAVLLSNDNHARTLLFDGEGRLLEQQVLLAAMDLALRPERATAVAHSGDGFRYFSGGTGVLYYDSDDRAVGGSPILRFGPDRKVVLQEVEWADTIPDLRSQEEKVVQGEIRLLGAGSFNNVTVSADGGVLFATQFPDTGDPFEGWQKSTGWKTRGRENGWLPMTGVLSRVDSSWKDFRLEADAMRVGFPDYAEQGGIQIGGDSHSRLRLLFNTAGQQVLQEWLFTPPADVDLLPRQASVSAPCVGIEGLPYHLSLEVVDGRINASVTHPVVWRAYHEPRVVWRSMATIEDRLALTVNNRAFVVDLEGEISGRGAFEEDVSEVRTWSVDGERRRRMGVCLPAADQVRWGVVLRASTWDVSMNRNVGPRFGEVTKGLYYPLSLDGSPDGRMYVLDAGNSRIVVFDGDGRYITEWGSRGSGLGEFNFGDGSPLQLGHLNFAGSICVDDEGYIYVADVFNQRIQKFAP